MANDRAEPRSALDDESVFEVAIGPGRSPGTFKIDVVNSPAGLASEVVNLDIDALHARRRELQSAILTSSVATRQILHETERPVREVGQALYLALLGTGEVAGQYRASTALAASREHELRVVLRIDAPDLAGLP